MVILQQSTRRYGDISTNFPPAYQFQNSTAAAAACAQQLPYCLQNLEEGHNIVCFKEVIYTIFIYEHHLFFKFSKIKL